MPSTRGRQVVVPLTNKSGGSVAAGDVVIVDTGNDAAFTTTTSARSETSLGVVQETIANNGTGRVLIAGYAALVNVPASVTRGHYIETHTVAKQAVGNSTRRSGSFGQFLTGGTTPTALLWGKTDTAGGSGAPTDGEYVTYAANGSLSAERVVTAPASGGVVPLLVRKASNEIVNNSSVLQNDDELKFAVAASEVVTFIMLIWSQSNTTPDIKFDIVGPAGSTVNWSIRGEGTGAAVVPGSSVQTGGTPIGMLGNGDRRHVMIEGFIANGATPGDLQLQWAQNTANGSDTTVFANSAIIAWRMA
jgi:hypothetical protein